MAYFPFFIELKGKTGLVAGGGRVALRKIEKLVPFGPSLEVCAPEILPEIAAISGLVLRHTAFDRQYLAGKQFVIAATDDRELNRQISLLCQAEHIPVNTVDDPDYCTFLFPALVQKGQMTIGITTSGASPTAARWLREQITEMLPEQFDMILDYLEQMRAAVKQQIPDERLRTAVFRELFAACMAEGTVPDERETLMILQKYTQPQTAE